MARPIIQLAQNTLAATPILRTLWLRRRYRAELALLHGESPSPSEHPSIVHFSLNKAATQFVKSILVRSGTEARMVPVGFHALAFASSLPYLDELPADEMERYREAFRPRGYVYSPFGGPIEGVSFDGFRVILMVRDPRDLLVSEYFSVAFSHMLPADRAKRREFAARRRFAIENGVDAYALRFCDRTRTTFERYARTFLGPTNVHFTKYETMIARFEPWVRELLAFCELEPSAELMRAFLVEGTAPAPAQDDTRSHRRQVSSGDYLRKLRPETIAQLNENLASVLAEFGYR
ncbi:MAG TPA: sulfotransferase domain-containing protein [Thermoanaerobaculia bacterium]